MKHEPCIQDMQSQVLIDAQALEIGYQNDTVVSDLNFQVKVGQSLALVGVNGSGKSTLLKTLVGLIPPIRGKAVVFGEVPGKLPRRISYLSQFHTSDIILPLRAIDVVRMGRFAEHGLLGKMKAKDDALVDISMRRMGILQIAEQPLRSLSGGQLQRVYIAQVLARYADLVVLDEPTSGLDLAGKDLYLQAVQDELKRGASVVLSTHDVQEAGRYDQVMLLARKVVAIGRGKDVITAEALAEAFGLHFSRHPMAIS